jgi:hypothetical protein
VEEGMNPIASVDINYKVTHLAWSPCDEGVFATTGKDHVIFCTVTGDKIKKIRGKAAKAGEGVSHCAAAWINDPEAGGVLITGGADGKLYHWAEGAIASATDNNKGMVHTVACRQNEEKVDIVFAGGNDKTVTVY